MYIEKYIGLFQGIMDNMIEPYPQDLLFEAKKRVAEKYMFQRK
jgi:hypothetical protein